MKHLRSIFVVPVAALLVLCGLANPAVAQKEYMGAPINYLTAPVTNRISRLQTKLDSELEGMDFKPGFGYLPALLKALDVPVSSQMLVYSKTSLQNEYIRPENPRAIYYNEDTYVGFVPGGKVLEITALDPMQGPTFYTLDQDRKIIPEFKRQGHDCLRCHHSTFTRRVPGQIVRSVFVDEHGFPIYKAGSFTTDQTSPLQDRWGGWYVTGFQGHTLHMGNVIAKETEDGAEIDRKAGKDRVRVDGRVDRDKYLSPHSDIVALMVLEHQGMMHNRITRANFELRAALHRQKDMDALFGRAPGELSDTSKTIVRSQGENLLEYMLFWNEADLNGQIEGSSSFAEEFEARGRKDRKGRSLRDLDLSRRMFSYPCSFLIHSEEFESLPAPVHDYVLRRLHEILTAKEPEEKFAHLDAADRQAILEILRDTKDELPDYWHPNDG